MRLTERIKYKSLNPDAREEFNINMEINSVLNYLQKILNTRQGSVMIAEDFGIPDFTNIPGSQLSEMAVKMEKEIATVLKKYEPRLKDININFETEQDDMLIVKFKLNAKLVKFDNVQVQFETILRPDGMAKVINV